MSERSHEASVGGPEGPPLREDATLGQPESAQTRLERFLAETGLTGSGATVIPLTGDASDRRYYRLLLPERPSQVLAVYPGPLSFEALPFVNVARLLDAMPVPVPAILAHSDALGVMALQDLGDVTLQAHLGTASPAEHDARYREAIGLIATLQRRGSELASPHYLPYGLAFDVAKLTWELDFFTTHFLEAHRGAVLLSGDRETLAAEYARIAGDLAAEPRVLCHRDYHSRNLMLHADRLHIIDFQDARMGPDTYDLVSLLRDSYVDFSEAQIDQHIAFFRTARGEDGPRDEAAFRQRFDTMAVQRNLKALGTFGFQATSRGNTAYLQYVPRTLASVRATFERHHRFDGLRRVLNRYLDELA